MIFKPTFQSRAQQVTSCKWQTTYLIDYRFYKKERSLEAGRFPRPYVQVTNHVQVCRTVLELVREVASLLQHKRGTLGSSV